MPRPRSTQICLEDTPFYHCVSRVVRRAFLCGKDELTGKNFDHRRGWIENQLHKLSSIFAIDVAAYSVMSNHLHVVIHIDVEMANNWSDREVVQQWHKLFNGTELSQRYSKEENIEESLQSELKHLISTYRARLCDISWFMRCLNEPIARRANEEDECTGHFWEGRFKSQALLDEKALIACMAYVELNPIRANIANTPEKSDFTSIKLRIKAAIKGEQPTELLPFIGSEHQNQHKGLPFSLKDYLELVDETGRVIRDDKIGSISENACDIINRLHIPSYNWFRLAKGFGKIFKYGPVGSIEELTEYCAHLEKRRRHFMGNCQQI